MYRASFRVNSTEGFMSLDALKDMLLNLFIQAAEKVSQDPDSLPNRLSWHYDKNLKRWMLMLQSAALDEARWFTGYFISLTEESWDQGAILATDMKTE